MKNKKMLRKLERDVAKSQDKGFVMDSYQTREQLQTDIRKGKKKALRLWAEAKREVW